MATPQQEALHKLIKDIIHSALASAMRARLLSGDRDQALSEINPRWSEILKADGAMPAGMLNATDFAFASGAQNRAVIIYPSTLVVVVLPDIEMTSQTIPLIPGLSTPSTCGPG